MPSADDLKCLIIDFCSFGYAGWNSLGRWYCCHLTVCNKPRRDFSVQVYS